MLKSTKFEDYIRKTLILYTVIITAVTLVVFVLFMVFNLKNTVIHVNESYNNQVSNFMNNQYTTYTSNIEFLAQQIPCEAELLEPKCLGKLNELLYKYSNDQNIRANFVLLDSKRDLVTTNLYVGNQDVLKQSNQLKEIIMKIEENPNLAYTDINKVVYGLDQGSSIFFAKGVLSEGQINGYLILYLSDENFKQYMRYKAVDIVVITDRYDNVIFTTKDLLINDMGKVDLNKSSKNRVILDETNYYTSVNEILGGNLKIITMTSTKDNRQTLIVGVVFLVGMSFLMYFLITLAAPELTRRNLKSLDALNHAILQLKEGNVDYRIQDKTYDEFQSIFNEFNSMMTQIQVLIQRNDEMSERKRQMEIKHLEGQFNPHFVFNVMEMLRYEILFDPDLASDMMVSFANLMRYNINYGNVEVPIRTDLAYVEDYLKLQKMRFKARLSYTLDIDPLFLDYKVPKLIFQPIVENSIKYGIEDVDHLVINIRIKKLDNGMGIEIEDNGRGIKEERLNEILDMLKDNNAAPTNIGLYNAHRVIQLLYGQAYGLSVASIYGEGTKVVLRVPLMGDDENA